MGIADKPVEFFVAADVQVIEPCEELLEIANGRVAKDLGFAVLLAAEPFGQMADQLGASSAILTASLNRSRIRWHCCSYSCGLSLRK